jgi:hypothetical protein
MQMEQGQDIPVDDHWSPHLPRRASEPLINISKYRISLLKRQRQGSKSHQTITENYATQQLSCGDTVKNNNNNIVRTGSSVQLVGVFIPGAYSMETLAEIAKTYGKYNLVLYFLIFSISLSHLLYLLQFRISHQQSK